MNKELKDKIDRWEVLDQFDRNQLRNALMLQNQNSREGVETYEYAQEKGII